MTPLPAALMWMTVALQAQHSAHTALEAAEALRVGLRTASAEARSARRRAAIEAYREVQRRFPRAHAEVAEAAVRAARLLVDEGQLESALAAYEQAIEQGAASGWRSRALVESAHELRRAGLYARAEAAYERAMTSAAVVGGDRDEALDWSARLLAKRGAVMAARERWRRLTRESSDALRRIEAWDRLANQWLDGGDIEAAAGELHLVRAAFERHFEAQDELSRRIVAALDGMSALRRAERMIERRVKATQP
ncbi:MAG: hypothetical protein RIT40_680 [Planctomycetota bacterium]